MTLSNCMDIESYFFELHSHWPNRPPGHCNPLSEALTAGSLLFQYYDNTMLKSVRTATAATDLDTDWIAD